MAKRPGFKPFILMEITPGDGSVSGGGTAHGGIPANGAVTPVTIDKFLELTPMEYLDVNGDGAPGIEEFAAWWKAQGFDTSLFSEYSNGVDWNPEWD